MCPLCQAPFQDFQQALLHQCEYVPLPAHQKAARPAAASSGAVDAEDSPGSSCLRPATPLPVVDEECSVEWTIIEYSGNRPKGALSCSTFLHIAEGTRIWVPAVTEPYSLDRHACRERVALTRPRTEEAVPRGKIHAPLKAILDKNNA